MGCMPNTNTDLHTVVFSIRHENLAFRAYCNSHRTSKTIATTPLAKLADRCALSIVYADVAGVLAHDVHALGVDVSFRRHRNAKYRFLQAFLIQQQRGANQTNQLNFTSVNQAIGSEHLLRGDEQLAIVPIERDAAVCLELYVGAAGCSLSAVFVD